MALTAYRNIAIGIGSKSDILERLCMSDRTLGDYTRVRCGSHEIVSMQDCQNACRFADDKHIDSSHTILFVHTNVMVL